MNLLRLALLSPTAVVCVVALWLSVPHARADRMVTIAPDHMVDWTLSLYGVGEGEFIDGPGTPPLGSGSLRFYAGPLSWEDGAALFTYPEVPLADVTHLAYSSYVVSTGVHPRANVAFTLSIDIDGLPPYTSDQSLVYSPGSNGYQGELLQWQDWDVRNAGVLFYDWGTPTDWGAYLQEHPSAVVRGIAVHVGQCPAGVNEELEACVDRIVMGVQGVVTIHNLDLRWPASLSVLTIAPGHLEGWVPASSGAGTIEFVDGPFAPPLGTGSARFYAGPVSWEDGAFLSKIVAIPLVDLTHLAYCTYVVSSGTSPRGNVSLGLVIDHDGVPPYAYDASLTFCPRVNGYDGTLQEWQSWDVRSEDVTLFDSGIPTGWVQLLEAHPSAVLCMLTARVGLGPEGVDEDVVACVDSIAVGVQGAVTVNDLELDWPMAVPAAGNASSEWRSCVFPNPVRGELRYVLHPGGPARVRLDIFDAAGRLVHPLGFVDCPGGDCTGRWSLSRPPLGSVRPGIYFLRAEAGVWSDTQRFLILK